MGARFEAVTTYAITHNFKGLRIEYLDLDRIRIRTKEHAVLYK